MIVAVYPGTFDPITNGHLDIIRRASQMFDELIIALPKQDTKKLLFSCKERVELINTSIIERNYKNIIVKPFNKLLVDFAKKNNASVIIRAFRSIYDFEYEHKMLLINSHLNKNIETIFLVANNELSFISSSFIKQICSVQGDITNFVPKCVKVALLTKF